MESQSCCAWVHVPSRNKAALKRKDVSWFLVCDTDVRNRQIWCVSPQNKFRDNPEALQMLAYATVAMASIPAVHRWEPGGLIRNASSSLKLLQQFYANPQWTEAPRVPKITRGLNAEALCSCSFVLKSLSKAFVLYRAIVCSERVMTSASQGRKALDQENRVLQDDHGWVGPLCPWEEKLMGDVAPPPGLCSTACLY